MHFKIYSTIFFIFFSQFSLQEDDIKQKLLKTAEELQNKVNSLVLQLNLQNSQIDEELIQRAKNLQTETSSLMEITKNLEDQTKFLQKVKRRVKRKNLEGIGHNTSLAFKLGPKHQAFMKKIDG
uniref:Centromere protein F n=1 Tax=Strongyloides stercoralis TaxID=6248 RepID=A0A0K0EIM9_STRER